MSDCTLTLLDQATCAHCTGAQAVADEPLFERGMEIVTREETETEWNEHHGKYVSKERYGDLKGEIAAQIPNAGRWNKTRETYGGNDGQVDFESIELEEQDAG